MSKVSHQAKVYNMLKEANGPVTVEQLLSIEGLLPYKLSAYVLYAKIDFGAVIKPIRDGRKVTAYELTDAGTGVPVRKTKTATPKVAVAKSVKVAKTPKVKTPKVAKTAPVTVAPAVMKDDKIVDILDEMDTNVASFEDREFAAEFVRSL